MALQRAFKESKEPPVLGTAMRSQDAYGFLGEITFAFHSGVVM